MTNQKWPCIFSTNFTKDEVNKRLYQRYPKFNFNAFTRAWRWEHCATLNPYGSDSCPYEARDCALAYMITAQRAMDGATRSEVGYFKLLARKSATQRADDKPLARDRVRTDGLQAGTTDLRSGAGTRPGDVLEASPSGDADPRRVADDGPVGLRRAAPRSIGSLLWGNGAGPHLGTRRGDEGRSSPDNDGDAGDPVSPSPPGRLGDSPPPGIEGVHQESE